MAAPLWRYSPPCYVRLYASTDGTVRTWLGWLGNDGVASDWALSVGGDEAGPPPEAATRVQWTWDAQRGTATDEASYQEALKTRPRYLSSCGRVLGGTGTSGFKLYWWDLDVLPNNGYELKVNVPDGGTTTLTRLGTTDPAGSVICTYGSELGYYKDGDQSQIWFEFVPATTFDKGAHPTWIADRKSAIGDGTHFDDRPLPKLVIPGSHDSGSWEISRAGGDMNSRTQQSGITDQLLAGARYLDLRTYLAKDGSYYMVHGSDWTDVRFEHVVEQLGEFLDDNPDEFVLVCLLVNDTKGVDGSSGDNRTAWQMLFNRVHGHHLNYVNGANSNIDITKLTPRHLREQKKNLLVFSWGAPTTWFFDADNLSGEFVQYGTTPQPPDGTTRFFVSPWPSKPEGEKPSGDVADLEGTYLDWNIQMPHASDLLDAYNDYTQTGGLWNFQTNLPFKVSSFGESVYQKHARITPDIVTYIQEKKITRAKANIVNMDYIGDTVIEDDVSYDLVSAVIEMNDA